MLKQDEILITRSSSSSNLNKCGFEQLDIQEETPVVSNFLNKSSNISEMEKFIDGKIMKMYITNLLNVLWGVNLNLLIKIQSL